jgi:hypothetical protein
MQITDWQWTRLKSAISNVRHFQGGLALQDYHAELDEAIEDIENPQEEQQNYREEIPYRMPEQ